MSERERAGAPQGSAHEPGSSPEVTSGAQMNPQVWAFGGAKGGVGRSVTCALIACELVRRGSRVILLDFDLGSANLHTLLGVMQPKANLEQWILGRAKRLDEVCSPTLLKGLSLISGASSIYNPSHPTAHQLRRLIHESLQLEADYILIDLGAGIHPHTLDFFNVAGQSFIITTPEPTSIQNSYAFYRAALLRRLEVTLTQHPWLEKILRRASLAKGDARITSLGQLLDMVRELNYELSREVMTHLMSLKAPLIINRAYPEDQAQVLKALGSICGQYLQIRLEHAFTIPEDKQLRGAVRSLLPLHELKAEAPVNESLSRWLDGALNHAKYTTIHEDFLPLVGQPSFLSTPPESVQRKTTGMNPSARSFTKDEAQLISAISALNEVQRYDDQLAAQRAQVDQLTSARDWKAVAWEEAPQDAKLIEGAVYGDHSGLSPMPLDSLPLPQIPGGSSAGDELSEQQRALREDDLSPSPLGEIEMDEPLEHEVVYFEEEVRGEGGWFHLKTSDLAPFTPAIRTTIYCEGERVVLRDKSYRESYERGVKGTDIAKRVERVHHDSAELLKRGGVKAWRGAHQRY